jgi:hypothetical protein
MGRNQLAPSGGRCSASAARRPLGACHRRRAKAFHTRSLRGRRFRAPGKSAQAGTIQSASRFICLVFAVVLRCSALTYLVSICSRLTPCTPTKSAAQLNSRPTESSQLGGIALGRSTRSSSPCFLGRVAERGVASRVSSKANMKLLAPLLLIASFASAVEQVLPEFDRYQQTKRFASIVREHEAGQFDFFAIRQSDQRKSDPSPSFTVPPHEALLLAVTVFYRDDAGCVLRYAVTPAGGETDWRDCSHAWQASHSKQLHRDGVTRLKAAISALPAKNTYPPLRELAIVSYRHDNIWTTRTLPASTLKDILSIIGERFETKKSE